MSSETAKVLMKKGKRGAAAYIHADCAGGSGVHVGPLMDVLLNPSKAIDEWDTIDWCRWLIAGGRTPEEYAAVVRSYDKHDKCGLVWIPRVVAYRCRTCGISPCMSICRECFHRGDHSTHDFNMFLSQAGGACDCGDNSVMKEDGFCSNHGNKCLQPGSVPSDLLCVAEAMMPRLILRLLQHFRENSGTLVNSDDYRIAIQECEGYVQMLLELNNMGDIMRSAMTKALINPQMYCNLVHPPFPNTDYGVYLAHSQAQYEKSIEAFPAPDPPDEYRHLPALAPRLEHYTLLDEFIFWTFKYEFPQNVVCFLLNMLPDQDYKEQLTKTFVLHYARIPLVLEEAGDPDTLSNRVVHMSVQLFSNEALALRCVQQLHLLHVMVLSLRLMMTKILLRNTLHDPRTNEHQVVDCTRRLMREHCYWPLVSDLNNVLSHRSVALVFLQDEALLELWLGFLSMLQGMNVNVRETGGHIEFEPSSYYAAFSCELEAAAYPMWSVLAHAGPELSRGVVHKVLVHLRKWLSAVGVNRAPPPEPRASFHYPLHRYAAAFLCAASAPPDVLPPAAELALLAYHPLRTQSLFYEILAGLWVRNGLQIKGQAMTYIQANFCNSMVDMDIYWLQVCAANLPADQFLEMCIDTFGVRSWVSLGGAGAVTAEQDALLEGLLTFLGVLVGARTNLGLDELTQSRLEVAALLAAADRTHSQLLELMPERSGNAHTRNFEAVLRELSTYRPPPRGSENLEQGLFVPTAAVWEKHYEPLHVLRRAVHRRDFHASMDRFSTYVRDKCKAEGSTPPAGPLWPPLRLAAAPPGGAPDPRAICSSGVLHGLILAVLHRGVHRRSSGAAPLAPPDHVLALCVLLLAQAADLHASHAATRSEEACVPLSEIAPVSGLPLTSALRGGSVCAHARTVLRSVPAPPPRPEPAQVSRSDIEVDEQSDPDVDVEDSVTMRALEDSNTGDTEMALALPDEEDMPTDDTLAVALPEPHYELDEGESSDWSLSLRDVPTLLAPSSNQIQEEVSDEQSIPVNESIISLLLKLHSQLSGKADSYDPGDASYVQPDRSPVIGDGPFFIGRVLHELCRQDPRCATAVQNVRNALWPHRQERGAEETARELTEREERSRRARERRQQVLAEFARRQTEFGRTLPELRLASTEPCAICGGGGDLALCVLIQSSALLAHRRQLRRPAPKLPLNEPRPAPSAAHHNRLHAKLQTHYDRDSWLQSVNLCWDTGIHVQSCGHVLHADCLAAYQRSLSAPQRPHNLLVERGEFLCPVCRQLANSVLPGRGDTPRRQPVDLGEPEEAIQRMLETVRAPTQHIETTARAIEDMASFASPSLRQQLARYAGSTAASITAASSLVRTALECELIMREDQPPEQRFRLRHCLVPLMEVVGTHAQVLRSSDNFFTSEAPAVWRTLTDRATEHAPSAAGEPGQATFAAVFERPSVPLLLRDPVALLIQFLLLAPEHPPHIDIEHFRCMVRHLYALHYWQVIVQQLARAAPATRLRLARAAPPARRALAALAKCTLLADPDPADDLDPGERMDDLLQPFVKTCKLLQELLFENTDELEVTGEEVNANGGLWIDELIKSGEGAECIKIQHEAWAKPALLQLPREYDLVFSHYHERVCTGCGAAPKEAAVCLLCGALLCLKAACCRRRDVCEAARHAERCGGGTAILLAITSTYTVVIRGRRACLWGSLYLDRYDEEDRDLKRGKPLYLSRDRFELLQAQWLAHRFDHTKRTWVWHRDSL